MKKSHALAFVPFLAALPAFANPATQPGADHLTQVFQTYLGTTAGVVSVAMNGDTYVVTLDVGPLLKTAATKDVTAKISPLKLSLTDNGDATWHVTGDQAVSVAMSLPNAFDIQEVVASQKLDGTFVESLMAFSALKGEFSGLKLTEMISGPNTPATNAEVAVDKGAFEVTSVAGASGGVDTKMNLTATGLSETITAPGTEGQPGMPITVKAATLTEVATGTGIKFDGIYKTLAWVVSHPGQDAMKADKAGLKAILTDALPVFANLNVTGTVSKLTVDTPMGPVGVAELSFTADLNGAVAEGKAREAFSLSGLTLPDGVLPPWAAPILPQKISLDVQITDFDAAAAMTTALGVMDLPDGTPPGPEFNAKLQAAAMPKGYVTITLNPGSLSGDGYELTYEGKMAAKSDSSVPTGTAKVTLTGVDKLTTAIQAAPDDMKAQAMMGFGMVQGMAKKDGNKLVWVIDATKPGSVLVNGTPVMGGN